MVSAATKRKKKLRGNLVAAAVEDGRSQAAAERKTLGTVVTRSVPDKALFVEDRKGTEKNEIKEIIHTQGAEQRRAARKARRATPSIRKSEAAILPQTKHTEISYVGKKKKRQVAKVENDILARRKFDKPEGHVGNRSALIREEKEHSDGKEDVWNSQTSEKVKQEICQNRKKLTEKMNSAQRKAQQVVYPNNGMSINPTHTDHQDKLGEALAKIVEHDDAAKWTDKKLSYNPELLNESTEGEVGDTGMKCDDTDNEEEDYHEEDDLVPLTAGAPERKTRAQRHKEARIREMQTNIARKRAEGKRKRDFENIDQVTEEATVQADKLQGTAKKRRLDENEPLPKKADVPLFAKIAGQQVRTESNNEPVTLSTELGDGIRDVKMPVANPMVRDRFLSFERRGLIEPPKVLPKEIWRMEQKKRQEALKDTRKRKGRGSRSNLTFWKNGKKVIQ